MVDSNKKIQTYLEDCEQAVLSKALANGLDWECYQWYLEAVFFALPEDCDLRAIYEHGIRAARTEANKTIDLKSAGKWAFSSSKSFVKQLMMLSDLIEYVDKNGDEVGEIRTAQLDFVRSVLWRGRCVLDTITIWAPSRMLLFYETESTQDYADALKLYDKVYQRLVEVLRNASKC